MSNLLVSFEENGAVVDTSYKNVEHWYVKHGMLFIEMEERNEVYNWDNVIRFRETNLDEEE